MCQLVVRLSLSVRRAWIEMTGWQAASLQHLSVALRKESVDRNDTDVGIPNANTVALRKESVDRNMDLELVNIAQTSRSP